jgi:pilus assembly protein CpaC
MHKRVWLSTLVAALAGAEAPATLQLGVGSQKVLTVGPMERLAVGDPAVADAKVIGNNQILLLGVGEGRTSLLVWRAGKPVLSYAIQTRTYRGGQLEASELTRLLRTCEDVTAHITGDQIYLEGEAHTADDLLRVNQVTVMYPQVKSFVRASPDIGRATERQLLLALQQHGYRDVKVSVVGATIFLEGTVDSEDDRKKAELIALALLPLGAARP